MKTLLLILLSTQTPAAMDKDPAFEVRVNPAAYDRAAFRNEGYNAEEMPAEKPSPYALPDKETRETAFASVRDLEPAIAELDQLDRDVLYVRAKTVSFEELKKRYPKISVDLLGQLQKVLKP